MWVRNEGDMDQVKNNGEDEKWAVFWIYFEGRINKIAWLVILWCMERKESWIASGNLV
jgi:hypothetical protein